MDYLIEVLVGGEEWTAVDVVGDWDTAGNVARAWYAKGYLVRVIVRRPS